MTASGGGAQPDANRQPGATTATCSGRRPPSRPSAPDRALRPLASQPRRPESRAAYHDLWQWSVPTWPRSGPRSGTSSACSATAAAGPVLTGPDARAAHWFAGSTLNYARNALRRAAAEPDAWPSATSPRPAATASSATASSRPGGQGRGSACSSLGVGPRRPGSRLPAEFARGADRDAGDREPRRDLDVVLAGLRRAQRDRQVRADLAQGAARRGRLRLRRQAVRPPGRAGRHRGRTARPAGCVLVDYLVGGRGSGARPRSRLRVCRRRYWAGQASARATTAR